MSVKATRGSPAPSPQAPCWRFCSAWATARTRRWTSFARRRPRSLRRRRGGGGGTLCLRTSASRRVVLSRPSAKGTRCQPANAHRLSVCSKFSGKAKHDIFERIGADATLADLDRYVMLTAFCMGAEVVRVVGGVPAGRVVALMRGAGCPNLTALCGLSCIAADNAARSLLRRRRTMAPGRHDKSAAACVSLRVGVTGLRLGARGLWLHSCACPSPQAGAVSPRMATFFSRTLRCERRRHPRTFPSTRSVAGALRASACTRL